MGFSSYSAEWRACRVQTRPGSSLSECGREQLSRLIAAPQLSLNGGNSKPDTQLSAGRIPMAAKTRAAYAAWGKSEPSNTIGSDGDLTPRYTVRREPVHATAYRSARFILGADLI
jgi:hypothetical protein